MRPVVIFIGQAISDSFYRDIIKAGEIRQELDMQWKCDPDNHLPPPPARTQGFTIDITKPGIADLPSTKPLI